MTEKQAAEELKSFWFKKIDWEKVKANLCQSSSLGKLVTLEQLQCPSHKPLYGVHPLARELGSDMIETQVQDLDKAIGKVRAIKGAKVRLREIASLENPSLRYWTWLSEIEAAELLLELGFDVQFRTEKEGPDLLMKYEGTQVFCEVTTSIKQELGFFELKQLLEVLFGQEHFVRLPRDRFGRSPRTSPEMIWKYFQEVRADIAAKGFTWPYQKTFEDEDGKCFSVVLEQKQKRDQGSFQGNLPGDDQKNAPKTARLRITENTKQKKKQLQDYHPNLLIVALVQDPPGAIAFKEAPPCLNTQDYHTSDAVLVFDTGDAERPSYGPFIKEPGKYPKLTELLRRFQTRTPDS